MRPGIAHINSPVSHALVTLACGKIMGYLGSLRSVALKVPGRQSGARLRGLSQRPAAFIDIQINTEMQLTNVNRIR
jgi:hypothetical protein